MWTFLIALVLALGVPAAARWLRKVSTRQAVAFSAALWALAQPESFGITIGRMFNFGDVGGTQDLLIAAIGGAVGAGAGVFAAFFASSVTVQRLLYLLAAAGASSASVIWASFLPGLIVSIAAAAAFAVLAAIPRPLERQQYLPRRLRRRPR